MSSAWTVSRWSHPLLYGTSLLLLFYFCILSKPGRLLAYLWSTWQIIWVLLHKMSCIFADSVLFEEQHCWLCSRVFIRLLMIRWSWRPSASLLSLLTMSLKESYSLLVEKIQGRKKCVWRLASTLESPSCTHSSPCTVMPVKTCRSQGCNTL